MQAGLHQHPFMRTLSRWVVAWAGCPRNHQWGLAAHWRVNTAAAGGPDCYHCAAPHNLFRRNTTSLHEAAPTRVP